MLLFDVCVSNNFIFLFYPYYYFNVYFFYVCLHIPDVNFGRVGIYSLPCGRNKRYLIFWRSVRYVTPPFEVVMQLTDVSFRYNKKIFGIFARKSALTANAHRT